MKNLYKWRRIGFFKKFAEYERTQFLSTAELKEYQSEKLRKLVAHAYENVPFYRERFDKVKLSPDDIKTVDDLRLLPTLDKKTFKLRGAELLSKKPLKKLAKQRTGGSTGVPLLIWKDYDCRIAELAHYQRFMSWLGYNLGDRVVVFWGERVGKGGMLAKMRTALTRWVNNERFISTFSVSNETTKALFNELVNSNPKMLRGYVSSLYLLAQAAVESDVSIQLPAISTTAEKLFGFQRETIAKAFGPNIFDQYGCGESMSLASECEKHCGLHVASEHVIMELLDSENQHARSGRVTITDLDNYAMPLIRYENGDEAVWGEKSCPCGRGLPLLERIEGRTCDFITGLNGKRVHAEFFTHLFNGINLQEKYLVEHFRVIQKTPELIEILFQTKDEMNNTDKDSIRELIVKYLGPVVLKIRCVEKLDLTEMGKRRLVIGYDEKADPNSTLSAL